MAHIPDIISDVILDTIPDRELHTKRWLAKKGVYPIWEPTLFNQEVSAAKQQMCAQDTVTALLTEDTLDKLEEKIKPHLKSNMRIKVKLVIVRSQGESKNLLPQEYVKQVKERLDKRGINATIEIDDQIKTLNTVGRTNISFDHVTSLARVPEYIGMIDSHAFYIVMDDHIEKGTTLNSLKKYIGKNVIGIATLTKKKGLDYLTILPETVAALETKLEEEAKNRTLQSYGSISEKMLLKMRAQVQSEFKVLLARLQKNDIHELANMEGIIIFAYLSHPSEKDKFDELLKAIGISYNEVDSTFHDISRLLDLKMDSNSNLECDPLLALVNQPARSLSQLNDEMLKDLSARNDIYVSDTSKLLPVHKMIVDKARKHGFRFPRNTYLVTVGHTFPDTVDLIDAHIALGIRPDHIIMLDKEYSRIEENYRKLADKGIQMISFTPTEVGGYYPTFASDIDKLKQLMKKQVGSVQQAIVMDDSGQLIAELGKFFKDKNIPVFGSELTRKGDFYLQKHGSPIPYISPCSSAIKTKFEPVFIGKDLLDAIKAIYGNLQGTIGIIGAGGSIGSGTTKIFADKGNRILTYDKKTDYEVPVSVEKTETMEALLAQCDHVFSATGADVTKDLSFDFKHKFGAKFYSLSSGDIEFHALMTQMKGLDGFTVDAKTGDVTTTTAHGILTIAKKGFPVNFINQPCATPPKEYNYIKSLLLLANIQGMLLMTEKKMPTAGKIALSSSGQHAVLTENKKLFPDFAQQYGYNLAMVQAALADPNWFAQNSEGAQYDSLASILGDLFE